MKNETPAIKGAQEWLDQWASIGGAVTISPAGVLTPWRYSHVDEQQDWGRRCAKAEVAEKLLGHLLTHPELHEPMRVILSAKARKMARPYLKGRFNDV